MQNVLDPHPGKILGEREGLAVIRCARCGYSHLREFPSGGELSDLYANRFWQVDKAGALADLESEQDWWQALYGDWLSIVEERTLGRTLLDAGCGHGFFLKAAQDRAWKPVGLDPNEEAATYARAHGFTVRQAAWDGLEYMGARRDRQVWEKHDCLSALWLLEHLPDALAFLHWARARLYGGGVLILAVPNDFSPAQKMVNGKVKNQCWWIHPHHLNYFNKETLANLLGRAGFRVTDWLATFPMEDILETGRDYTDRPLLGTEAHKLVREADLDLTRPERVLRYRERADMNIGRDLICIAEVDR